MPLPPEEAENGENAGNEEPKLQFSYVECLLYSFHQLGRKLPDFLTAKLNAEKLKDFKIRWYIIEVPQSLIKVKAILKLPWFCFHFARAFPPPFLTIMQKNARPTKQECIQRYNCGGVTNAWQKMAFYKNGLWLSSLASGYWVDSLTRHLKLSSAVQFIDTSTHLMELRELNDSNEKP